ncbi:MAG: NAD(P)H-binding protein, partial [Propionicimonas sp.]
MRMTVVGGSRGTGAQVVRIAAEAGHQVTCLSRNGAPAPIGGVSYLTGDALNAEVAQAAVSGADAVVVSVGGAT